MTRTHRSGPATSSHSNGSSSQRRTVPIIQIHHCNPLTNDNFSNVGRIGAPAVRPELRYFRRPEKEYIADGYAAKPIDRALLLTRAAALLTRVSRRGRVEEV
jgi:hypothetical protein